MAGPGTRRRAAAERDPRSAPPPPNRDPRAPTRTPRREDEGGEVLVGRGEEKVDVLREPPRVRSAVRRVSRGFHARGARCPRRQSLGLRAAGLSGCPRTDSDMLSGARAPVLGLWPLRVYTYGRQRPTDVRAPVSGRSRREEDGHDRQDVRDDVACPACVVVRGCPCEATGAPSDAR